MEDLIDKRIQDRGPSFVTKNVIDARCILMEIIKDNNLSVTCQSSLTRSFVQSIAV